MFIQKSKGNVLILVLLLSLLSSSTACLLLTQVIIQKRIVQNFYTAFVGMNNNQGLSCIYRRVDEQHVQQKES